ncbi:putative toxin-antitoxin system toxin component, PIN family [Geminocystis sp.]|uniref:putative toxin-antitoxin system toxin component, PIN family n=1 Tax=Geminocystis sp. TaxID=2664100 RepID=UPI0035938FD0
MRIVIIDTNIVVSAVLKGKNPEIVINFISNSSSYQWIVSPTILHEYQEVLNRPKLKLNDEIKQKWLTKIHSITKLIKVDNEVDFPRDQKDAKFISCAIASQADFLITGDKDFEEVREIGKTIIISVSLFKDLFIDTNQ